MDAALPVDEVGQIEAEIGKLLPGGTSFHDLRTANPVRAVSSIFTAGAGAVR